MAKTLYVVDGHAQIYRAYYAPFRPLSSSGGEPTRATYVFCQMLLNLIRDRKPDYLVMVLDADESQLERRSIYPEYKAHREPPPEDLPAQERRIVSILEAARIPVLCQLGHEADDLIATLIRRYAPPSERAALASATLPHPLPEREGGEMETLPRPLPEREGGEMETLPHPLPEREGGEMETLPRPLPEREGGPAAEALDIVIVSRDKDLEQLLGPHVAMFDPLRSETITAERLPEVKGWRVDQAIDAQILTGDSVDNVPGVTGVGPKTAATLLQKYGSLAGILEHLADLSPKQRENLQAAQPRFDMVRRLVTLRTDIPLTFDLETAACAQFTWHAVRPIFEELGFRRLVEQLPAEATKRPGAEATKRRSDGATEGIAHSHAATLAAAAATEVAAVGDLHQPAGTKYELINTPAALAAFAARLAEQPEFAVDTETTAVSPIDAELVGLSFAWEVGRGYYVPVRGLLGTPLPLELVRTTLGPILADASKRKVGQNIKYDLNVLRGAGFTVGGALFDTMIAAHVLDPLRGSNSLDALSLHHFGFTKIPTSDVIGKGRDQLTMDQVPIERVAEYAAEDADYTWRLRQVLEPRLAPAGVDKLFYEVEMPLVGVLTDMEHHGISLDARFLEGMSRELGQRAAQLVEQVQSVAGTRFNVDSPKQLAEVLFDKLEFRVVRRTKTTRSTDAETLEVLGAETKHPLFPLLLEYRELQKLLGTYVDALPRERSRRTGRIHTSYHQTGTVTGRLSSSEPNLQNIPIRTEAGRRIRQAFVPRTADEVLIVADYSQIELRVLAHFSEDEALTQAFAEDQDIHAFVAAQVNGVPLAAVTKEMRGRAKAVNFGIIYGQTAHGLAQATGLSRTDAQGFIDAYFRRYPRIRRFMDGCVADAKRDGFVRTILGRRRPIENIDSRNVSVRAQAERFAVNTVVQGSAADLIKVAMIHLHERIAAEKLPLRMLLQIHDELVCEGPRAAAAELAGVLRSVMTGALPLRVPLKVDVGRGENWLAAK
jgi:DNA polymerase-1